MRGLRPIAVVVLVGGCSFLFVDAPPRRHRELAAVQCTSSNAVPIVDTVITALQALNLITAASKSDDEWDRQFDGDPPFSRKVAIGTYGAFTAIGAGAMIYGYATVSACRDAKDELRKRAMAPGPWPVVAPPPVAPPPPVVVPR